jgi:HlyD family secretion protein
LAIRDISGSLEGVMKKKLITGSILFLTLLALLGTAACDSLGGSQETVSQQQVEVTRDDLTISVTGNGKIQTSREARLTFSSGGKVAEILVEEGDVVKAGDVLAGLDTDALELAVDQAKLAVTQAEVALTQAQLAQRTAEYNLKNTRDSEDALELALLNAEIALSMARTNLEKTLDMYTWSDVRIAQADVDEAERYVKSVTDRLGLYAPGSAGYESLQEELLYAQARLTAAKDRLEAMLGGSDVEEVAIKKSQVEAAELSVAQAQKDINELSDNIALQELQVAASEHSVTQAQQAVDMARESLDDARKQLEKANIIAPFDGVVALVTAEEGDIIPSPSMSPTIIIQMIDPGSLELVIEVDELDIPLVTLGREVAVTVDALPDAVFTGLVKAVYPVPSEVGGVVLYKVRIGLETPENSGIMVGMSASADIVAERHENVLIVPSRAIGKNDQGQTIVKVKVAEGVQEREVVVGLDDGLRAEIVSGLSEGETVVYEVRVKSVSMSMF